MFVWPYAPNWAQGFEATFRFRTTVILSEGGKEQRIATRFEPRVEFDFDTVVLPREFQAVQRDIFQRQNEKIIMPFWPRSVRTTTQTASGSTTVDVASTKLWMVPGAYMAITNEREAEAIKIASVSGTTVTLESATSKTWPVSTRVCEGYPGHLSEKVRQKLVTDRVGQMQIEFAVAPGETPSPGLSGPETFLDNLAVFDIPVNWRTGNDVDHEVLRETVDYGYGVYEHITKVPFPTAMRESEVLRFTDADLLKLEQFFRRSRGSQREFYAPTHTHDLVPASGVVSGTATITIEGIEAASYLQGNTVNRAVQLKTPYGEINRQIVSASISGVNTVLTLRTNWVTNLSQSDIKRVSILNVSRFSSDAMTIKWQTPEVGGAKINLQSLEDHWGEV